METNVTSTPPSPESSDFIVLDIVAFLSILWRRKLLVVGMGLLGFAVAVGVSYTRPKIFEATLRFMPPSRPSGPLSLVTGHSNGEEYRAMLNSNTIADDVVDRLDLVHIFKVEDAYTARKVLHTMAKFTIDSNNFISVAVSSTDPKLAAAISNEFYAALYRKEDAQSAIEAQHRLKYMSGPLELERQQLAVAEDALRDAQQKTGLVLPAAQGALGVQQVASLRSRVSDLQSQLATALVGSTNENPRVVTLRSQIANLQGQIASLQGHNTQSDAPGRLPELGLEVQRREREVRFHTATVESLTKALETTQATESYTPGFILVDPAEVPRNKVSPSRWKWALAGGFLFAIGAALWVLASGLYRRWWMTPDGMATAARWKRSWHSAEPRAGYAA
jgi:uncharacterized protein involved in exopolysaccharide biosynthesis